MLLTKLKIFGFKSFTDKIEINLGKGITAIVGPNGCGKTNIVDAIRWVFGEQRNRVLRSDRMEDVIFSGTSKRQPLNMAEVSLTIDNQSGILPVEYTEVMVTRRIFRSGESEYLLNKVPCRLKDINNLFFDTGLGTSAYSTLEGRMIDAILSEKADERRILFEEAAGISKYKRQRQDSLRQLERTNQDMGRISDKVEEVSRNVKVLQRHVEKARKYRKFTEDLRNIELSFENRGFIDCKQKLADLEKQLAEMGNQKTTLLARRDTEATNIEQINLLALEKEKSLQAAQEKVYRISQSIVEIDRDQSVLNERSRGNKDTLQRFQDEIHDLKERISETEAMHVNIEQSLVKHRSQVELLESDLRQRSVNVESCMEELVDRRNRASQINQEHIRVLEQISAKRNQASEIKIKIKNMEERKRNFTHERSIIMERLLESEEEAKAAKAKLQVANEESTHLTDSREKLLSKIEDEEVNYRSIVEEEKGIEAQLIAIQKQLHFLEALNVSYEGYAAGAKAIMEHKDKLTGIKGVLADRIKVKPAYIRAIESFLGQNAQTIIMETVRDVEMAIEFIGNKQLGRATLLALDRLAEKSFAELPEGLLNEPGVLARGTDCVQIDPSLKPVVQHLLDYVIMVKDRVVADQLAQKWSKRRLWFITPEGECHATSGFITGGKTGKTETGLISRKQTIEKLINREFKTNKR